MISPIHRNNGEEKNNSKSLLQPKLAIGQPNDKYEKEADEVANKIIQMPETPPPIQKKSEEEESEELQMKPLNSQISPIIQKQETSNKNLIQTKIKW